MSLKEFLEKEKSDRTLSTEQSSVSTRDAFSLERSVQRVRFAEDSTGSVQCETHLVDRVDDPKLWWQDDEMEDVRAHCAGLVRRRSGRKMKLRASTVKLLRHQGNILDFLTVMHACDDLRGLEFHLVPECGLIIRRQQKDVLEAQEKNGSATTLRQVSEACSRSFLELAIRRAQYDEEEAIRACRVPWGIEDLSCFD